ncbi:hypothetical protein EON63_00865 [archaeon]|nr:MAG: hypothetical protein EON63_00865 [archaeon]
MVGSYYGQDMDKWLYQNMDSTVFFAAGNVGSVRSITRESSSKNVISVGSSHTTLGSDNITYVAFYSSRGPVYDNRFKPDIVSPGHQLNAARASGTSSQTCDTVTYTGTSMATPAAAGVALMVRQYFLDSRFWPATCNSNYRNCRAFTPSGVLVRAVMVHGGARMTLFDGGGSNSVRLGKEGVCI